MAASKRHRVLYMRYRYTPETARAHNRLYSPGGCGCALLMAPVVALGAVVTIAAMGGSRGIGCRHLHRRGHLDMARSRIPS